MKDVKEETEKDNSMVVNVKKLDDKFESINVRVLAMRAMFAVGFIELVDEYQKLGFTKLSELTIPGSIKMLEKIKHYIDVNVSIFDSMDKFILSGPDIEDRMEKALLRDGLRSIENRLFH